MAEAEYAVRIEMFGDEIEAIHKIDPLTGKTIETVNRIVIYPSSHYVTSPDHVPETIRLIQEELEQQITSFQHQGKLLEAQRLSERVRYDIEMIEQVGFCSGIENYSRILQRRKAVFRRQLYWITFRKIHSYSLMKVMSLFHKLEGCMQEIVLGKRRW